MTASEPLSIHQEYEMQQSWALDEKSTSKFQEYTKCIECTFIIACPSFKKDNDNHSKYGGMIGDVNLYLCQDGDVDMDEMSAEVEVMIAETSCRKRGYGRQSVQLMMTYARRHLNIHIFLVKISSKNIASRRLFERGLEFKFHSHSQIFDEDTLIRHFSDTDLLSDIELDEYIE